jgi:hypothetical protein
MTLPHPHDHLVRHLQASADPRDQALAAILLDMDGIKVAVFGRPSEPEEGLMTRVTGLERFRHNTRLALTVGIPTALTLIFGGITAFRHFRDIGMPPAPAAPLAPALPGRTPE